jgi:hypothetical protein
MNRKKTSARRSKQRRIRKTRKQRPSKLLSKKRSWAGGNPMESAVPGYAVDPLTVQAEPYQYPRPKGFIQNVTNWGKRTLLNDPEARAAYEQKMRDKQLLEQQRAQEERQRQLQIVSRANMSEAELNAAINAVSNKTPLNGQLALRRLLAGSQDAAAAVENEDYVKKVLALHMVLGHTYPAIYYEREMLINGRTHRGLPWITLD